VYPTGVLDSVDFAAKPEGSVISLSCELLEQRVKGELISIVGVILPSERP